MKTEVVCSWTEEGVNFVFRCDEPDVGGMPSGRPQGDDIRQDTIDIIIETGEVCHQVSFDAAGRASVFANNIPQSADGVSATVAIGENEWRMEAFVPFSVIGEGAKESFWSREWRGNLIRWRPGRGKGHGEWSRLSTRRSKLNKDCNALVPFVPGAF
jgi:hypothetical protein